MYGSTLITQKMQKKGKRREIIYTRRKTQKCEIQGERRER